MKEGDSNVSEAFILFCELNRTALSNGSEKIKIVKKPES